MESAGLPRARRLRGAEREPAYVVGRRSQPHARHQRRRPQSARAPRRHPLRPADADAGPGRRIRAAAAAVLGLAAADRRAASADCAASSCWRRSPSSSLPARSPRCLRPPTWPLHHGYGGVLGDLGLGLLASLLAHVNADRSAAAAGLFYFAAGLMVLMSSLGLSRHELRLICQTNATAQSQGRGRLVQRALRPAASYRSRRRLPSPAPDPSRAAGAALRAASRCWSSPTRPSRSTSTRTCRARAATPRSIG